MIWTTCISSSISFNPTDLLNTGFQSLFNWQTPSTDSSVFSEYRSDANLDSYLEKNKQKTLFRKPIANKNSVLESLYEINAREYLQAQELTSQPTMVETKVKKDKKDEAVSNVFQNIDFLPLVKNDHKHHHEGFISPNDKPLIDYLNSMRGEAWSHFKSIIKTYIESLDSPSSKGLKIKDSYPIKFMMRLLDTGDQINIIHLLGKKVDPEASKFLLRTLKQATPNILGFKNITEGDIYSLMPIINKMINQFAWFSLRHIIDDLMIKINSSFANGELEKYITDLEVTNPFAAKGVRFVLSLPSHIPNYNSVGEGRSFGRNRKLISRDGYGYHDDHYDHHMDDGYGYDNHGEYGHKDIGYGHKDVGYGDYGLHDGGSYGYGGGHYMGIKLDPYLILAGIGTAALLAFVAFKVFTTMAPGRKKRSTDDIDLVSHVLNSIEDAENIYESSFYSEAEDLVEGVNVLWNKRLSEKCARCSFFDLLMDKIGKPDSFKMILL